jgi:hypothetical protein
MKTQTALVLWGISTLFVITAVWIKKTLRGQPLPNLEKLLFTSALSVGGIMINGQLIWKAYTIPELHKILEWDGLLALILGSAYISVLAVREIFKLF